MALEWGCLRPAQALRKVDECLLAWEQTSLRHFSSNLRRQGAAIPQLLEAWIKIAESWGV